MSELKPCPFCGGPAQLIEHSAQDPLGRPRVDCQHCRIGVDYLPDKEQCIDMWNRRTPPEGMALVPRKITAESGHKAGMIGEFTESVEVECSQCDADDPYSECDECEGLVFYQQEVAVSWPTLKAVHKRIVELSEADAT